MQHEALVPCPTQSILRLRHEVPEVHGGDEDDEKRESVRVDYSDDEVASPRNDSGIAPIYELIPSISS